MAQNTISSVYLAKLLAPHLQVTEPEFKIPLSTKIGMYLSGLLARTFTFLTEEPGKDKKHKEFLDDYEREEKKIQKRLAAAGIVTEAETNAFTVTHFAGLHLDRLVRSAEYARIPLEVVQNQIGADGARQAIEIAVNDAGLAQTLAMAIKDGIYCLEDHYYGVPFYKGMPRQFKNVNPDFEQKAVEIFLKEVMEKTSGGDETNLLGCVAVKRASNGMLRIRYDRLPEPF